jgi:hypothetical protein
MEDPASVEYITRFIAGVQQVRPRRCGLDCSAHAVIRSSRKGTPRGTDFDERVLRGVLILTKGYSEEY